MGLAQDAADAGPRSRTACSPFFLPVRTLCTSVQMASDTWLYRAPATSEGRETAFWKTGRRSLNQGFLAKTSRSV